MKILLCQSEDIKRFFGANTLICARTGTHTHTPYLIFRHFSIFLLLLLLLMVVETQGIVRNRATSNILSDYHIFPFIAILQKQQDSYSREDKSFCLIHFIKMEELHRKIEFQ